MNIVINGENKIFDEGSSLKEIIVSLKIEDKVMAAAVNMDIVKKDNWATFIPKEDDTLELLQFVGGG
jgi:sulfur carrier protein